MLKRQQGEPLKTLQVYKSDLFSDKSEQGDAESKDDKGKVDPKQLKLDLKKKQLSRFGLESKQNTMRDEERESDRKGDSSDPSAIIFNKKGISKEPSANSKPAAAAGGVSGDGAAAAAAQNDKVAKKKIKKPKVNHRIRLDDLRFMLEKDRNLTNDFSIQMQNQIINERNYYFRIKKNIEYCLQYVIPNETIPATGNAFKSFCEALQYSQDELLEYLKFLEDSAVPSIDYLSRQIGFIDLLILDFERKLNELFQVEQIIDQHKSKKNFHEAMELKAIQEKAQKSAEYSGINLRNKLQLYIKDRNNEIRELVLHINRAKVQYHGQSLSYFTAFFFKILERDPAVPGRPDSKKEQKRRHFYFKQCQKALRELIREKKVDKYIPYSDDESAKLEEFQDKESGGEASDIDENRSNKDGSPKYGDQFDANEDHKKQKNDPILEKMNFDGYFNNLNSPPMVKSVHRASVLNPI